MMLRSVLYDIMYRLVLLSVCVVVALAGPDHKCMSLMHPDSLSCCKKETPSLDKDEDIKECLQIPHQPKSCEREICIGLKKGISSSDGTIDKKVLTERLSKLLDKEPDMYASIKEKCVDGDLTKYGPPDACDLMKLKNCLKIQYIDSCPEWDDSGKCEGIKDLLAECKSKLQ